MSDLGINLHELIFGKTPTVPNISPSALGTRPEQQSGFSSYSHIGLIPVRNRQGVVESFRFPHGSIMQESYITQMGNYRHRQYQNSNLGMFNQNIPEYPVRISEFGDRTFYLDLVRRGLFGKDIEEVKTVDYEYLMEMTQPKESAVAQSNAYMYALEDNEAQITYVARESANVQRTFNVPYQPGRLIADIVRNRQQALTGNIMEANNPINIHYHRKNFMRVRQKTKHADYGVGPVGSRML